MTRRVRRDKESVSGYSSWEWSHLTRGDLEAAGSPTGSHGRVPVGGGQQNDEETGRWRACLKFLLRSTTI